VTEAFRLISDWAESAITPEVRLIKSAQPGCVAMALTVLDQSVVLEFELGMRVNADVVEKAALDAAGEGDK
jgi:hypothetical protein